MDPQGAAILATIFLIVAAGGGLFAIIRLAILSAHDTAARRQKD